MWLPKVTSMGEFEYFFFNWILCCSSKSFTSLKNISFYFHPLCFVLFHLNNEGKVVIILGYPAAASWDNMTFLGNAIILGKSLVYFKSRRASPTLEVNFHPKLSHCLKILNRIPASSSCVCEAGCYMPVY